MYVPTKDNPADYLSRGWTSNQLKSSNWLRGPSWLLTRSFLEQSNVNVVVNELTVEINPIHPIKPLIDLTKYSSFIRVVRIMTKILEFCQSPANPFEKLVRQEQLLHCTSIHAHLNNKRVNVNVEVKTIIKQLNLYLENDTIRSKGRIINSELPLDATTPLFLPNKSHLVDLFINHIHSSHNHVGLSQTLSLYRQRCWTPKIRSHIKSLLLRCVTCQRVKGRTLPRPLPPPLLTGRSIQPCRSGPHGEFLHQRHAGEKEQGVHLPLRVCDYKSSPSRGSGKLNSNIIRDVFTTIGSN